MTTMVALSKGLGFPVTQSMAALLTTVMAHKGDLKVSSIKKVLVVWASHFQQFWSYITKMSDEEKETLQIVDSKVVQGKIDS